MTKQPRKRLGDLLVEVGIITREQLETALEKQKNSKMKIGEIMIEEGYITQQQIMEVLEFQLGIPYVNLDKYKIDPKTCLLIPESLARRYGLIPIQQENDILTVAMSDPLNVFAIDDIKIYSGFEVQPVLSAVEKVDKAIDKYYSTQKAMKAVEEFRKEQGSSLKYNTELPGEEDLEEINNSPAVKLVNSIIEQAVRNRASDIHIEPFEEQIRIRYRVDGQLSEVMRPEADIMPAIVARIKIIAGMNIAEKRLPQDGRISIEVDEREYDLRVSTLLTVFGEKIVIRIADKNSFIITKDKLGFNSEDKALFEKILMNPHGIVLVTGPTGSGKSTTLYSAINEINRPDINIVTIEDPVECIIEGVNQTQVNYKTGLTFAAGLRTILRQDPNVIMIGEIRDSETAQIAVRSAITGHLVFSTLHTNTAPGSVVRLINMGVEPYLAATSIVGVISQRLVKKICENCREAYPADETHMEILGVENKNIKIYRGRGCPVCNGTGYLGRLGVYEVMTITKKHRQLINKNCSEDELKELSVGLGMKTLKDNVRDYVLKGITTIDEMIRISYSNQ